MKNLGTLNFGEIPITFLSNSDAITVAELEFAPGVSATPHHHVHEEIDYVLEGTFEVNSDGKKDIFTKGDLLDVSSDVEHYITNVGDTPGKILTVWSPSRSDFMDKLVEKYGANK